MCIIYLESSTVKRIFISTLDYHIELLGYQQYMGKFSLGAWSN